MIWHDVEHSDLGCCFRMFHRKTPGNASTSIMTGYRKPIEPHGPHHFDLIENHSALRVVGVILAIGRLTAVAVSPEVWRDHCESLRKARCYFVPRDMRLWESVEEQKRWTASCCDEVDLRT